ncbi:MAG: glycosyltransferase family 39 protein [Chloroflexi bacterium]|nr:glycosyltransferase family 39 protein [Chloroflexota bacterium]
MRVGSAVESVRRPPEAAARKSVARWLDLTILGQHWTVWLSALALLAAALGLAYGALEGEAEALVTALLGLAIGYAITRLLYRGSGGSDSRFVTTLFLAAFALRVVLSVGLHFVLVSRGTNGFLLMDDRAYDKIGWALPRVWWGSIPGILESDQYLLVNYTYLIAFVYYFLGHSLLAAKMLNPLFGALAAVLTYGLAREMYGRQAARISSLLAAFFPSLLVWSAVNLKDTLAMMIAVAVVYATLVYARRRSWWAFAIAVGGLLSMENLRPPAFFILAYLMPLAVLLVHGSGWREHWRQKLLLALPAAVAVFLVFQVTHNLKGGWNLLSPKSITNAEWARWIGARSADSVLDPELGKPTKSDEAEIVRRNIEYLPRGVYYVLTAPLPWEARSSNSRAVIPEMLLWYVLLVLAIVGLLASVRSRWRELFMPLGFSAGWIAALALNEGNAGNLFRHRAQLMPFVFVVSAVGLVWLWQRHQGGGAGGLSPAARAPASDTPTLVAR